MDTTPSAMDAPVRRITVDERLTEDLIRIEVCRLAHSDPAFADRSGEWTDATAVMVRRRNYVELMGIPPDEVKDWPWDALHEGMAFLSGAFERVDEEEAPLPFRTAAQSRAFVRIDDMRSTKDGIKAIYSELLKRGRHEHTD